MSDNDPAITPPSATTGLIHHGYQPPAGFQAVQPPIFKASTVIFPDTRSLLARGWKDKSGYSYGLLGTPSTYILEERIANLEGGLQTVLAPSGLAAIALVDLALLSAGDEVLIPDNAYGPGKDLARADLSRLGITHRCYDPMDPSSLAAALSPATRLVWLEAAGSVTMEFPDLSALIRIARTHGACTALDNTWGAGIAFNPFAIEPGLGVDISVHALTKYPSGGADVLMGSVTTRDESLHLRIKATHMRMGCGVAANDVELLLRSLPTMALRYHAADQASRQLAAWWADRPEVSAVLHPALNGSPGHAHWHRLCAASAGLFSVVFDERYSAPQVHRFIDALRLFKIGFSWAGPMSLVVPYDLTAMRRNPAWRGVLVRFSLGLENVEDLMADSLNALEALQ
jgi:cystathionine beta-lyase